MLSYSSEAEMSGELAVGVVFLHRCLVWHILEWDWDGRKGDGVRLRVAPWTLHTLRGPRWCSLHGRAAVRFTAGSCMVISVEFELTGGRRLLKKSCLWDLMRNRRGKVCKRGRWSKCRNGRWGRVTWGRGTGNIILCRLRNMKILWVDSQIIDEQDIRYW